MPIFEFICEKCHHVQDTGIIRRSERPDSLDCERCNGTMKPAVAANVNSTFPQGRTKGGYFRPDIGGRRYQKFY